MLRVSSGRKMPTAVFGVFLVALGLCAGTLLAPMRYGLWWDVFCSCGGSIMVVVGLLATVKACAPNLSTTLLRILCGALIVSYVGWYSPQVLLFGISESDGYGRCQDLVAAVVQTNVVPQSVSRPGQPAVFCSNAEYGILRSRYQVLQIYSVPMDAQNVVLAAVSSTRHRLNGEGVQVVFYQRENWRIGGPYNADGTLADKDGTVIPGSATRGPEKIERVSVIR